MQEMEADNLAANLRTLCSEYGAVQRLANHLGVTRVHMSRVLHGKAHLRVDQAQSAAEFYGVTLRELLLTPEKFQAILKISA